MNPLSYGSTLLYRSYDSSCCALICFHLPLSNSLRKPVLATYSSKSSSVTVLARATLTNLVSLRVTVKSQLQCLGLSSPPPPPSHPTDASSMFKKIRSDPILDVSRVTTNIILIPIIIIIAELK